MFNTEGWTPVGGASGWPVRGPPVLFDPCAVGYFDCGYGVWTPTVFSLYLSLSLSHTHTLTLYTHTLHSHSTLSHTPHSTLQVFRKTTLPLVDAVLSGTNGCIFAFGQTGSGKTYSMLGPEGGRHRASHDGVLPLASAELFRRIARLEQAAKQTHTQAQGAKGNAADDSSKDSKDGHDDSSSSSGGGGGSGSSFSAFEVRASFLEIYCENAFDLLALRRSDSGDGSGALALAERNPSAACAIREQQEPHFRVFAEGATEERVTSTAQLLELVARGAGNRATAKTGVHDHSSRSHAVMIISVEHRWRDRAETDARRFKSRVARLTLVDLAGAESMERSHGGFKDDAGVGTNLGLLHLCRVIHALAKGDRVPFRDSTLTRLLQTSLGGSAVTQMLACVSPAERDVDMTLSTLQYASSGTRYM